MKQKGFTLIELLIVVAIIAILAAIAVPNFLEAQARSKVARAKADIRTMVLAVQTYIVDWNTIFPDNVDLGTPAWRKNGNWYYSKENPNSPSDMIFLTPPGQSATYMERFYTKVTYVPLTTPVSYLTSIPLDPFSRVVPMGLDTRENPGNSGRIAYAAFFAGGPDKTEGNWYRTMPGQNGNAIEYDSSNGTISPGDVTRVIPIKDGGLARKEYPFALVQ